MENGNPRDASMIIVLSILIVPVLLTYLWVFVKNWLEGIDNLSTDDKYLSNFDYLNKHKDKPYTKEVKQVDRERPPNASFFCKVDGKETFIEGPYEEKFLTGYEAIKWKYKKKRRELKKIVKS